MNAYVYRSPEANHTAKLIVEGQEVDLPTMVGTEQEKAVDISQLRKLTGYITLDEGYVNTGSTTSAITYLDGEQGILRYRGYRSRILQPTAISSRPVTC